jgi:hypothetical protein
VAELMQMPVTMEPLTDNTQVQLQLQQQLRLQFRLSGFT